MRADIVPGAVFPDYELPDHRGKHRKLSELQQGDPLVLVLARGGFCPKDRRQHEGLLQLHREMQVGYCLLVTISTDNLLDTNEFRAGVGALWPFLFDPGRKLQKDLDIAEYTDPHHDPMIPHTLVLEPGLRVYKIYNGYWFFGRPTVEELRLDLRAPCCSVAVPIGTSAARSSAPRGRRVRRRVSFRTEERRHNCWPNRTDPNHDGIDHGSLLSKSRASVGLTMPRSSQATRLPCRAARARDRLSTDPPFNCKRWRFPMIRELFLMPLLAAALIAQQSLAAEGVRNVVLVHGAWADGSSWAKVIPLLEKAGLKAVAVQNPLTSFADDLAATKRAIALQDGPVILVGHSWGGAVISEAGIDPKVAGLVYVAALVPDVGETVGDLGKDFAPPPGLAEARPDAEGYLTLTTKGVMDYFAPDLPLGERKIVAATQGATNSAVFGAKIANAAWKTKPTWYVVAANDKMIQPDLERKFAKAMNAKTITLPCSHVAMLSRPSEVAKLIIEAARTASARVSK